MLQLKDAAIAGMRDYLKASPEAGYSEADIGRCEALLLDFLGALSRKREPSEISEAGRILVLRLNELNARCNDSLIETDQREEIVHLVIEASKRAGLRVEGDFTEQWREW